MLDARGRRGLSSGPASGADAGEGRGGGRWRRRASGRCDSANSPSSARSASSPYPDRFARTHTLAEARALGERLGLEVGAAPRDDAPQLRLCGRLMALRDMGRLGFARLQDHSGALQLVFEVRALGQEAYRRAVRLLDVGDHLGAQGRLFYTRKGELSLLVEQWQLLSKALRPLPEKWHGLRDRELCWRQRYLDLLVNPETRERFRRRGELVRALRAMLEEHGFVEVETPVLTPQPSGALARPFVTHHHALDLDVYLRIAPETWLKRLIVGGYDRVYEFARCFRNEGMDPSHLQDFTMLEWYAAWWNYLDNMEFTEQLVRHAVERVVGGTAVEIRGRRVEFGGRWERRTLRELILQDSGIDIDAHADAASLRAAIAARGIDLEQSPEETARLGRGSLIDRLYKVVSRPRIDGPLFITAHPADLSPLARRSDEDPARADRFQLVVAGWEVVNAYSELIDPLDQRARLEQQAAARAAGDAEAMVVEEDYLLAMEHGMPPVSGFGLGIDRFAAPAERRREPARRGLLPPHAPCARGGGRAPRGHP
ncbi:MAG: lysine--tRNA ligase [Planctomycetota bacterium]|nr:MAG: lysine--tRNA ligase [Planctomycetota bacterium]